MPQLPGADATLALALRAFPPGARVAVLDDPEAEAALRASGRFAAVVSFPASAEAAFAARPSRKGPLLPTLQALAAALPPGGVAVVSDVVWQTAPTPDLARAFAPVGGAEKVRPIEGYEMQLEHAGFAIAERLDFGRDAWLAFLPEGDGRRPALAADDRGAARVSAWRLVRGTDV